MDCSYFYQLKWQKIENIKICIYSLIKLTENILKMSYVFYYKCIMVLLIDNSTQYKTAKY